MFSRATERIKDRDSNRIMSVKLTALPAAQRFINSDAARNILFILLLLKPDSYNFNDANAAFGLFYGRKHIFKNIYDVFDVRSYAFYAILSEKSSTLAL